MSVYLNLVEGHTKTIKDLTVPSRILLKPS